VVLALVDYLELGLWFELNMDWWVVVVGSMSLSLLEAE